MKRVRTRLFVDVLRVAVEKDPRGRAIPEASKMGW